MRLTSTCPSSTSRVCTNNVRSLTRSYGDAITKFSQFDGLPIFITHGALLARFTCTSSANNICDCISQSKLDKFFISVLQDICGSFQLDMSDIGQRRKKPYIDFTMNYVEKCSCK